MCTFTNRGVKDGRLLRHNHLSEARKALDTTRRTNVLFATKPFRHKKRKQTNKQTNKGRDDQIEKG